MNRRLAAPGAVVAALALLALAPSAALAQGTAEPTDPAAVAQSAGAEAQCAVTGYVASSREEALALSGELRGQEVAAVAGQPLDRVSVWSLPDGGYPVVVVDSAAPLAGGEVRVAAGGQRFGVDSSEVGDNPHRYVTSVIMPHLGDTTRTLGFEVDSGACAAAVTLVVDRGLFSTVAGQAAVAAAALFTLLTVLVARASRGGWLRRFLWAAPLGLLAGAAQVAVLHEAGVLDPFGALPWWGPVAGLVVAALLPLTRWPRRVAGSRPLSMDQPDQLDQPEPVVAEQPEFEPAADAPAPGEPAEAGTPAARKPEPARGPAPRWVRVAVPPTVAVVAAAAVVGGAVLADTAPAAADPLVVTPERAEVIVARVLAEAELPFDGQALTEVIAGVEAGQMSYPASFVAAGRVAGEEGDLTLFGRFARAAADEPWELASLVWSSDDSLPGPQRDDDGWLVPPPEETALAADVREVADVYHRWLGDHSDAVLAEERDADEVADFESFTWAAHPDSYLVESVDFAQTATGISAPTRLERPATDRTYALRRDWRLRQDDGAGDDEDGGAGQDDGDDEERPVRYEDLTVVTLDDDRVLLSFEVVSDLRIGAVDEDGETGPCGEFPTFHYQNERFATFRAEIRVQLYAWVPLAGEDDAAPVLLADPVGDTECGTDASVRC